MSFANTFYMLGTMIVSLGALTLIPLMVATTSGESEATFAFMGTLALSAFFGGGLLFGLRDMPRRSAVREAVFLIVIAWIVLPLFASLPFRLSGTLNTFTAAYFESVSALTTTGATIFAEVSSLPKSILIWRAALQWLGGLGILMMTIGIFSAISFSTLPVAKPPVRIMESQHLLERLRPVADIVWTTYCALTLICFVLLWFSGLKPFEALAISFATISTGGFMTIDGSFSGYESPGAELIVTLFMLIGAVNFVLHYNAPKYRLSEYRRDPEVMSFLFIVLILGLIIFLVSLGDKNPSRHLFSSLFNASSLLSTTGFAIGEDTPLSDVPLPLLLGAILIGGSALSTAGGIKLIRFILLTRHMRAELNRLAHPHSITTVTYWGKIVSLNELTSLWAYFACFTALFGLVALGLAFTGLDFTSAFSASAAALSNAGPVLSYAGPAGAAYHEFAVAGQWVVILAMILGRIEILVILPVFTKAFWDR